MHGAVAKQLTDDAAGLIGTAPTAFAKRGRTMLNGFLRHALRERLEEQLGGGLPAGRDLDQTVTEKLPADPFKGFPVGAYHRCDAGEQRFKKVVTAQGRQAAADKGRGSRLIGHRQFAEYIADDDGAANQWAIDAGAAAMV